MNQENFIKVINGNDIFYEKNLTWKELNLSSTLKSDIKKSIDVFLDSKDFYNKNNLPWKKGILLSGPEGVGKTKIIKTIISNYDFKPVTIASSINEDLIVSAFEYAETNGPSLLYFQNLDFLFDAGISTSLFLNLMDKISTENGLLVIVTANNLERLPNSIKERSFRFDKKYEIPLPNQRMIGEYLKKLFSNIISKQKCMELAKYAEKNQFSYSSIKEIYTSSFFQAMANNRKTPSSKDIDTVLECLMKDKLSLKSDMIDTSRYF